MIYMNNNNTMNQKNSEKLNIDLEVALLEVDTADIIINEEKILPSTLITEWVNEIKETSNKEDILIRIDKQNLTTIINLL